MVTPGLIRWALTIVIVALILALMAAAVVVMASAILEPQVVPTIKVQPDVVKPGDIVVVTGRGWPTLVDFVVVIALSPIRELTSESLVPVGASPVALDGTIAATFVYPADLPWTAVREAWVVARPATGNLQAVAHLVVHPLSPTRLPTAAPAATLMPGRQQVQGIIEQMLLDRGVVTVRPFDGSPTRGVIVRSAAFQFADGRTASLADLRVGRSIAAFGWLDSSGSILAETIMILEVKGAVAPASGAQVIPPTSTPVPALAVPAAPGTQPPALATCAPVPAAPQASKSAPLPAVILTTCTPAPTVCSPLPPTPIPTDVWRGEYYPNPWLMGPPVLVRQDRVVDFNWRYGSPVPGLPSYGYSMRWSGYWHFPRTCRYRFYLLFKGSGRLIIDGRVVINQWDSPPSAEYATEVDLSEGLHNLWVEYRNMGSAGYVQLRWEFATPTV